MLTIVIYVFMRYFLLPMKHPEKNSHRAAAWKGQAALLLQGLRPKYLKSMILIYTLDFLNSIPNETPGERIPTEPQPKKAKLLCCFNDYAKKYSIPVSDLMN